ncbi:MAG: FHA domain-containing protein [Oscillibacter sp.]|nr:FHA domain-containing protein [Oscillibacter sp.]
MNRKRLFSVLCAVLLLTIAARAASGPRILQRRFDPDTNRWTLYVLHPGGAKVGGVTVDGAEVADATLTRDPAKTPVVTWILFDNSDAVPDELRDAASDLLLTLLGEKGKSEVHTFCTFSDRLRVELRESGSFTELKERIDALEYDGKESNPVGALNAVLAEEGKRTGAVFARIILISPGGDSVPSGIATRQLRDYLQSNNVPIYTVGYRTGENDTVLSWLYALSARTGARAWDIDETGASDIANIMHWEEIPVRVLLTAPDGGEAEVTFDDGTSARTTIPPTVAETPTPTESDPEPAQNTDRFSVWWLALFALLFIVLGGAFVLRRGGRRKSAPGVRIRGEDTSLTLYLKDMQQPEREFSAPLQGRVSVGRSDENKIVLNYDQSISRAHCEIAFQDNTLWVRDLDSSGGTRVDGERVTGTVPLPVGAVLRLGHVNYQVEAH